MDEIYEVMLDRNEAKYLIPAIQMPAIQSYIASYCSPDKHSIDKPNGYIVTTLQLDNADKSFHMAKPNKALTRFKLRVRTYGTDGQAPVFLEIKRKIRSSVVKTRASISAKEWGPHLFASPENPVALSFRSSLEANGFYEFVRLTRETCALPAVRIRYARLSYFGLADRYARVTFDSRLCYQRADDWSILGCAAPWHSMDSAVAQGKDLAHSSIVLELKSLNEPPRWMVNLVQEFDLRRVGNCKYSTAIWQDAWHDGIIDQKDDFIWVL